ncbi:gliding motility lipoprotein GldD [Segetibacter sp. 3557_3]|uniref:gliding motility lipoprotein GldD n=1 Tax=Segetibacter sp. 3557_3 TaxID=2547429 RepID=UPI001058FA88|nr:gliding motility lipoprotein GldD [Segetibacter sp. 3557_3]TDH24059.1 gliding motility lipoprotein GldD [Segetibacter sp. 3557_3]
MRSPANLKLIDLYNYLKSVWVPVIATILLTSLSSCNSDYTPKPKGYFKIPFPTKAYQQFNEPGYPYSFEYPVYAKVLKDSSFFNEATENPWWINIDFPQFNGKVHVSYKQIGTNQFDKLVNDAFTMTNKHNVKAYSIDDSLITTPNNVHGLFFKVGGNVATANQFFLTDSTRHFLRGALYFDAAPNEDSLGIVNRFLLDDVRHMINTFKWK